MGTLQKSEYPAELPHNITSTVEHHILGTDWKVSDARAAETGFLSCQNRLQTPTVQ